MDNLEATIAISGNFVDRSNLGKVVESLEGEARCGFEGARVLAEELRDEAANRRVEERMGGVMFPAGTRSDGGGGPGGALISGGVVDDQDRPLPLGLVEAKKMGGERWTPYEKARMLHQVRAGAGSLVLVALGIGMGLVCSEGA